MWLSYRRIAVGFVLGLSVQVVFGAEAPGLQKPDSAPPGPRESVSATRFTLPSKVILGRARPSSVCYDYAVEELKRLLEKLGTGVVVENASGPNDLFWLWFCPEPGARQKTMPAAEAVRWDGFTIRVAPDGVTIVARQAKGVLNAVYDLAERLGCLFLYPSDAGEWMPQPGAARPSLPVGTAVVNPRFPFRGVFGGFERLSHTDEQWLRFFAKLRFNAHTANSGDLTLARTLGIRLEVGGHGMSELLPRDLFKTKPDLFRMSPSKDSEGRRTSDANFCPTNPETASIVKKNYRTKLRALVGVYALHAWPDDLSGGGWCECPRCRAYTPSDQAMLAMRMLAEAVAEEHSAARVPVLAYHDTMYPGKRVDAPREGFLLYAPRERCYGHALNDPNCPRNQWYLQALKQWTMKFRGIGDAHTLEYYFDQILFRGLYPFLPYVIVADTNVYEACGIESHLSLQVGGPLVAPEYNLLVFSRALWDKQLAPEQFIAELAKRIVPQAPDAWTRYLAARAAVFTQAMRFCAHSTAEAASFDYRNPPGVAAPPGATMVQVYGQSADALDQAADALERAACDAWPRRAKALAKAEAGRAHFEAAGLRVMAHQQDAANKTAQLAQTGSAVTRQQVLDALRAALKQLEVANARATDIGLPKGDYEQVYFPYLRTVLKRDFEQRIENHEKALRSAEKKSKG